MIILLWPLLIFPFLSCCHTGCLTSWMETKPTWWTDDSGVTTCIQKVCCLKTLCAFLRKHQYSTQRHRQSRFTKVVTYFSLLLAQVVISVDNLDYDLIKWSVMYTIPYLENKYSRNAHIQNYGTARFLYQEIQFDCFKLPT